jgi:hypothetical protein
LPLLGCLSGLLVGDLCPIPEGLPGATVSFARPLGPQPALEQVEEAGHRPGPSTGLPGQGQDKGERVD